MEKGKIPFDLSEGFLFLPKLLESYTACYCYLIRMKHFLQCFSRKLFPHVAKEMDYVELAISNSSLTTSLMVPVLWDSSCKLGTHYGPLKYFQKNVKNEKIGEL